MQKPGFGNASAQLSARDLNKITAHVEHHVQSRKGSFTGGMDLAAAAMAVNKEDQERKDMEAEIRNAELVRKARDAGVRAAGNTSYAVMEKWERDFFRQHKRLATDYDRKCSPEYNAILGHATKDPSHQDHVRLLLGENVDDENLGAHVEELHEERIHIKRELKQWEAEFVEANGRKVTSKDRKKDRDYMVMRRRMAQIDDILRKLEEMAEKDELEASPAMEDQWEEDEQEPQGSSRSATARSGSQKTSSQKTGSGNGSQNKEQGAFPIFVRHTPNGKALDESPVNVGKSKTQWSIIRSAVAEGRMTKFDFDLTTRFLQAFPDLDSITKPNGAIETIQVTLRPGSKGLGLSLDDNNIICALEEGGIAQKGIPKLFVGDMIVGLKSGDVKWECVLQKQVKDFLEPGKPVTFFITRKDYRTQEGELTL